MNRPAKEGELCACGEQALIVHLDRERREVGYCGLPAAPEAGLCPWCCRLAHPGALCPK